MRNFLAVVGGMGRFLGEIAAAIATPPFFFAETRRALHAVAFQCLIPVLAIMTAVGMIGALQGLAVIRIFGADHVLSSLLAESILREMAPSLGAIMIAAQAGTAIAGEIGTMRVKEEIDALGVMAVPPIKFVVVPRLIALVVACPLISLFGSLAGMLGGYMVAVGLKGVTKGVFVGNLLEFVHMNVIMGGMLKSVVFGALIGLIACYYGYNVTGGAQGVGKASNKTVVHAIVAIAISNYFITTLLLKVIG
ncbi:putative phospholipid ABC transporter permease protein MlaE [compost metagenome]